MVKKNLNGGAENSPNSPSPQQQKSMKSTISNFMFVLSFMSPYILIGFFLLLTILNFNGKGIIYALGVLCLGIIISKFQYLIPTKDMKRCNLFGDLLNDIPSFSTSLYSFTLAYLFMAMMNSNIINVPLIIVLSAMGVVDAALRLSWNCTNKIGILYGTVFGFIIGALWYTLWANMTPHLLYFDEYVSNKVACSVPKQQDFVCRLYKDGQEIEMD